MSNLQQLYLESTGIDYTQEIEQIVFNTDVLMLSLKSGKLSKYEREMLSDAVNIVYGCS